MKEQMTPRRMIGITVWLYGLWNTYFALELFFLANTNDNTFLAFVVAVILQAVLTALELDIRKGKPTPLAQFALAIDVLCNATGIYLGVLIIPDTRLGQMIMDTTPYTFGYWNYATLPIACVCGWFVAQSAERLIMDN